MDKSQGEGFSSPGAFALSAIVAVLAFFVVSPALRPVVVSLAALALVFLLPKSAGEGRKAPGEGQVDSAAAKAAGKESPATTPKDPAPRDSVESEAAKDGPVSVQKPEEKAADYLKTAGASPGARALAAAMKAKATAAAAKAAARPITGTEVYEQQNPRDA